MEVEMAVKEIIEELMKLQAMPCDYKRLRLMVELAWTLMCTLEERLNQGIALEH